jgi:hypothetical protein
MLPRRSFALALMLAPMRVRASPPVEDRRLQNRLELWQTYARNTEHLVARYELTRESSLLAEPKVVQGSLAFLAPDRLALHDDGMSGAITEVDGTRARVMPNTVRGDQRQAIEWLELSSRPGLRWLCDRLFALLGPGEPGAPIADARASAPRKRAPQLELLPPSGSPARREIRSLIVELDPLGGAIRKLVIAEAQGDATTIRLSDHRRDVSAEVLRRILPAAAE